MKKNLLIINILLFVLTGFSSEDSLRKLVNKAPNDSSKVIAYYSLVNSFHNSPTKSLELLSEMVAFSKTIENKKHKALCYRKIGVLYRYLHYYDKALEYYYASAELFEEVHDKNSLAYCYNNIANAFHSKGTLSKDKSLFMRAIEYHEKSISIRNELKDTAEIKNCYNNISTVYIALEEYDTAIKLLRDAHQYFLNVAHSLGGVQMTTSNLGSAYLGKAKKTNKPEYYRKSLAYFTDLLNSYTEAVKKEDEAIILESIGRIYKELGQLDRSKNAALRAHSLFTEIDDEYGLTTTSALLAELYQAKHDYKTANDYLNQLIQYKDSLTNRTSRLNSEQMQIMYESSKKDKEIENLNHDKEIQDIAINKHRNFLITTIAILALVLLLVFVLLSRYNIKRKANNQLSKAYKAIERKNKQITDSINYAKRIQTAILPPEELLKTELKNFFIYYQPKDIVSGDFYWFNRHNGARFFIIGDCTGHGVPGALMSMIGNTLLNEIILQKNIEDPGKILEQLHTGVVSALRQQGYDAASQDDGMDVTICVLKDSEPYALHFATANHCLFIKTANDVKELTGDIYSIGGGFGGEERKFTSHTEILQAGSFVVLSSDGFYDQFGGEKNSKFLITRFEKLIRDTDLLNSNIENEFKRAIERWRGNLKQTDDILVTGFMV
jgi:serine phosphatase RsbU (regulator of sigma subunit)